MSKVQINSNDLQRLLNAARIVIDFRKLAEKERTTCLKKFRKMARALEKIVAGENGYSKKQTEKIERLEIEFRILCLSLDFSEELTVKYSSKRESQLYKAILRAEEILGVWGEL